MPRFILFSFLLCCCSIATSQSYLYLKKLGGKLAVKYEIGDEIRFQLKSDQHFTRGMIESFGEDFFVVFDTEIKLTDVYRYDIRGLHNNNFDFQLSSNTLFLAAGLLPTAELVNQQVSGSGDDTGIHRSIWIASGSMVVGSLIIKWLEPKFFKPSLKKKATIIQK